MTRHQLRIAADFIATVLQGAIAGLLLYAALAVLVLTTGCGKGSPINIPTDPQKLCQDACLAGRLAGASRPVTDACLQICSGQTPPPVQPTPTSTPLGQATITATVVPTATVAPAATATPTSSGWVTTIKLVNGFGNCNPRASKAEALASPRTRCDGDRTFLYVMPGYDIIPKGTGCAELWGNNPDPGYLNKCLANDGPGTPCNGAAACDQDHLGCPRTAYGCNGRELGDPRGSILRVSSTTVTCASEKNPGFSIECGGTSGDAYTICARPYPDPHDEQGNPLPVQGSGELCKSGWF